MTRLLTLTGPGGSGKTRLALEAARDLAGAYPDGVWLVELAPLSEPGLVSEVARALGMQRAAGQPLFDTLVEELRDKGLDRPGQLRTSAGRSRTSGDAPLVRAPLANPRHKPEALVCGERPPAGDHPSPCRETGNGDCPPKNWGLRRGAPVRGAGRLPYRGLRAHARERGGCGESVQELEASRWP